MRLIDAVWVEEKFKKALDTIAAHMANSVMSEDDENIKAGQNQYSAYSTALTILKHAPTIEAVPVVHAELVYSSDDIPPRCSICETIIHADSKYCRECGARLVVERYEKGGAE